MHLQKRNNNLVAYLKKHKTMKLRNILSVLAFIAAIMLPTEVNSQAEVIEADCRGNFQHPYIVTNQPFKALLAGDEIAEFKLTLFSGTTYRISAGSAGNKYIIFSVFDNNHNLLFTNKDYDNAPYWDFQVEGYMDCIVEAKLDNSIAQSGFAIIMTGFKLNE